VAAVLDDFVAPANECRNENIASHEHCPVPARLGSDTGWRTKNLCGRALSPVRDRRMHLMFRRMTRPAKQRERETAALFHFARTFRVHWAIFCCRSLTFASARQLFDRNLIACSFGLLFVQTFVSSAWFLPIVPFARAKSSCVQLPRESVSAFSVSLVYPCDGVRLSCQSPG
jgi:hypothetical protein